ncbi:MAG: DUF3035 domain-containing protein [Sphingomonas sp.]
MRLSSLILAATAGSLLAGCVGGGPFDRRRPDEFAVARNPELIVPPDYALTPPTAGQADPGDPSGQALQALFGGPQARSAVESNLLNAAGVDHAAVGARSVAGDPQTTVVNRGALAQTILQLPQGDGQEASVQVPQ